MRTIRLLLIGDLHFPSSAAIRAPIDDKDSSFPSLIRDFICESPLKAVFRQANSVANSLQVNAILFVGDLTDYGDLDGYDSAVEYLAQCLFHPEPPKTIPIPIICVPGNHDINRDVARSPGLTAKFTPLNKAMNRRGLPQMPTDGILKTVIADSLSSVVILSANSCWGCGADFEVPSEFRAALRNAIEKTVGTNMISTKTGRPSAAFREYYDRQLDTPAFPAKAIQELRAQLSNTNPNCLPIVLAHHNLMSQRLTRLLPYTELVNSGALRSCLTECARPIIYLHGHTHDDTLETIVTPAGGHLTMISAPQAIDGFNVLEISFTSSGMPVGVRVREWRINKSGSLGEQRPVGLSLTRPNTHSPQYAMFYGQLLQKPIVYWRDIMEVIGQGALSISESEAREYVECLALEDRLEVDNFYADPEHWIIRMRQP